MATEVTPKSGLLPLVSTGTSHATLSNRAPSAATLRKCMTLSQVRFGNPTGVARGWRAVASWLCVAGFRRLCLCRTPSGRGRRHAELLCVDSYANETAANTSSTSLVAVGPADLATFVAVVP